MKLTKTILLVAAMLLSTTLFAQSPEKMSYQAVVRGADAALVMDATVGMKISIVQGAADGTVVYTETQTPMTNANGLVSIMIGTDATFADINWAMGPFFIKTEVDVAGGENYAVVGTSELLSVPFALNAKTAGGVPVYTFEEIAALMPSMGDAVFNSTDSTYQVFDGMNWSRPNSECWPIATPAEAGENQESTDGTTEFLLAANTPEPGHGVGEWIVIKGEGGMFDDATSPISGFTGELNNLYTLGWVITTDCGADTSTVTVNVVDPDNIAIDVDGNEYTTVVIGAQRWLTTNMRVTKFPDGTDIPVFVDFDTWKALPADDAATSAAYYADGDSEAVGNLYTYAAATNGDATGDEVQGICPDGYRVPSTSDWQRLFDYAMAEGVAEGNLGAAIKSTAIQGGEDTFGLSLDPGGYLGFSGTSYGLWKRGYNQDGGTWSSHDQYYMTSTTADDVAAYNLLVFRSWNSSLDDWPTKTNPKNAGNPVRCMRDEI